MVLKKSWEKTRFSDSQVVVAIYKAKVKIIIYDVNYSDKSTTLLFAN